MSQCCHLYMSAGFAHKPPPELRDGFAEAHGKAASSTAVLVPERRAASNIPKP